MTACRSCGASLCDCPDLAFAGIAPAKKVRADAHAGPAVCPAASGRIRTAGKSPSGRTAGAAGHGLNDRPGCNSVQIPLHEDAQ